MVSITVIDILFMKIRLRKTITMVNLNRAHTAEKNAFLAYRI